MFDVCLEELIDDIYIATAEIAFLLFADSGRGSDPDS